MKCIKLKEKVISQDSPVYIIAEMSASHAGSYQRAIELIHIAKECGADCIKTQTYTADTLTLNCAKEQFMIKSGLWAGYNFYRLYQEAYTPWEWQKSMKEEAEKIGLDFFSTPFDRTAVDFLEDIQIDFYKVASFELIDIPLIQYIASKGKPMIMSTGMATVEEIHEAVEAVRSQGNDQLALLKCSSVYPAEYADMNLITIPDLSRRFDVVSGLSDHSMGSLSSVVGVGLGAKIIEKHLCVRRNIPNNPDAGFSMEPDEFKQMVKDVRTAQMSVGTIPYTYSQNESDSRFSRRSLYICENIKKGEAFTEKNIRSVRPGYGLHTRYYRDILDKHASYDIEMGTPLSWEMVLEK